MAKVKHAQTIAAHVKNELADAIDARAAELGVKRGRYIAMILEKWVEEGCPPVSPADSAMQEVKKTPAPPPRRHKQAG